MKKIRIAAILTLTVALFSLMSNVNPVGAAPPLLNASGGGILFINDNEVMFAFNARLLNVDGTAEGQFEQHNLDKGGIIHLDITKVEDCLDGSILLYGEVTKAIDIGDTVSDRVVRIKDGGEGKNAADKRSKLYKEGELPNNCSDYLLLNLVKGNIQLRAH